MTGLGVHNEHPARYAMVMNLEVSYLFITGAGVARRTPELIEPLVERSPKPLITVLSENASRVVGRHQLARIPGHQIVESYFDEAIMPWPAEGVYLVAPCTFNSLNKLALGIADTLAHSMIAEGIGRGNPVIVVPAVNAPLWAHPRARQSVETLRSWGVQVLEPELNERGFLGMTTDDKILEAFSAAWAQQ